MGNCEVCDRPASDQHHILHRGRGGTDHEHNLLTVCRACHEALHGEKGGAGWTLARTDDALYVLDAGGTIIVERHTPPAGWDQGAFVARIDQAPHHLSELSAQFRFLDDAGVVAVAEALGLLEQTSWTLRARLFRVALLRTPWGTRGERLHEVSRLFGLEKRQAWKEARALEVLDGHPEIVHGVHNLPSPDAVLLAAAHNEPQKALELLIDRKNVNPSYGPAELRAELRAGNTDSMAAPPAYHACPECGARHIIGTP